MDRKFHMYFYRVRGWETLGETGFFGALRQCSVLLASSHVIRNVYHNLPIMIMIMDMP
jgi:hypothetical protein